MIRYAFIGLTLAALAACNGGGGGGLPPWALGEQPNFSGSIVDWAKGDAIAPGDGGLYGVSCATDPEGSLIGFGGIKADASFTFGLQRGAVGMGGGVAPAAALCPGLSLGNPQQKIAWVEVFSVGSLYQDGAHARPGGGIFISVEKPALANIKALYTFFYASADGTLKGSCQIEEVGAVAFDLDLRKGWNAVRRDQSGFKTAAMPAGAKWYFINPLTAGQ